MLNKHESTSVMDCLRRALSNLIDFLTFTFAVAFLICAWVWEWRI